MIESFEILYCSGIAGVGSVNSLFIMFGTCFKIGTNLVVRHIIPNKGFYEYSI